MGVININEARAILGLSPIEGGEVRLQSLNFVNTKFVDEYQLGRAGGDIGAVNEIQETETPESKVNVETKQEEKVEDAKQEEKVEETKQENENVNKQDVKEETKQEEKVEDAKQEVEDTDKTDETDESELPEKQKKKKRRNKK